MWRLKIIVVTLALCAAACATSAPTQRAQGEAMAAAADPRAVAAALEMMERGGSAVDAAIAAEMVLGLVEPQSSGIGGGGFLLFYDAANESVAAYDGRERAPAGASPDMFIGPDGQEMDFYDAQISGRSIGTPMLMQMLQLAHDDYGRLPWADLFAPAIRLAEEGFVISPRLATTLRGDSREVRLRDDAASRAYFYNAAGEPHPAGYRLRNPEYAETLRALAARGPAAMQEGPIAESIVAAAQRGPRAGTLTLTDLQAARARRYEPVCGPYRAYRVCTAAPPSSANTVIAILGLYQRARPTPVGAAAADDWAAFLWASRLAYADRDHYMADDETLPMPTEELIAPAYLDARAALIDLSRAPERVEPGAPAGEALRERWGSAPSDDAGTTHLSIVDAWGNAVALTATVESYFGAQRMASGFLLNNQLTDFSFTPSIDGRPVANAVAPRKRPRSSMSPTIVTDANGELVLVIGSPGGSDIIGYVARATIGILDWNEPVQVALGYGNATGRYALVPSETHRWPAGVADALRARGWRLDPIPPEQEGSGLHAIRVTPNGLEGGADPRGEGTAERLRVGR